MTARGRWFFKVTIATVLLGWLLSTVDLAALGQMLAEQSPVALLAMSLMQLAGLLVATAKWRILLPQQRFIRLFRLNMAALFYSLVVPGQIGAEAIKAYQLGRGQTDAETIAASVMLDKVTGLLALLALGLAGALLTRLEIGQSLRLALLGLFVSGVATLVGIRLPAMRRLVLGIAARVAALSPGLERVGNQFTRFVDAWCDYLRRPAPLLASLVLGVAQQGIYIAMIVLLARQFGFALPVVEWCWIFALVSVAAILPITLAGVGVREGVFVGLLAAFGIAAEPALALSLTTFALHVLFGLVGGLGELLRPNPRP